ncbi:hypothetical protein AVDCRST_MAG82-2066, partial [uncultured Rubrobacteraceae bacterium]
GSCAGREHSARFGDCGRHESWRGAQDSLPHRPRELLRRGARCWGRADRAREAAGGV